ncbi:aquaporin-like protein [Mycoemilia scoparia]|uniref:Aquaporin-like protein n=1 Tax=Mycoemilia scoparia TaxID=417184 RepID=A0A9W8DLB5_9FUNG|nr:aquaporin-like protein [Mycoemilia scoparia]
MDSSIHNNQAPSPVLIEEDQQIQVNHHKVYVNQDELSSTTPIDSSNISSSVHNHHNVRSQTHDSGAHETIHVELHRVHSKGMVEEAGYHHHHKDDGHDHTDSELLAPSPTQDFQTFLAHYSSTTNLPLYKIRQSLSEYFAEFFGTMLLILFGDGVVAMTKFNTSVVGAGYVLITFGWGLGLCCALYVCMGVSGGHLNPAVTFALALFGKFPFRKVPGYWLAQMLGGLVGGALVFGLYRGQFDAFDGGVRQVGGDQGTGGIFYTLPAEHNTRAQSAYSEILNTALLLAVIMGINDPRMTPAEGYKPVAVGILVITIGMCTGFVTGYAINPARDFGPRCFTAMAGWGKEAFTYADNYFVIPLFCPIAGAVLGVLMYELFILPKDDGGDNNGEKSK